MSKQSTFCAAYPDVHAEVQKWFPNFDYRQCTGDRNIVCRMDSGVDNKVGHQQRAFGCWWAIEMGGPIDAGLELGSPRGMTPHAVHVDVFGDGRVHPFYGGGRYTADIAYDAAGITAICPADTFPFIISNHSLEHMPGDDAAIVAMLGRWTTLLRPGGGILAMIVPDNEWFDVMGSDRDHKNAWGHTDFRPRILDPLLARGGLSIVEYDTLDNHFAFNCVIRRDT